jgi:hypothetical protein
LDGIIEIIIAIGFIRLTEPASHPDPERRFPKVIEEIKKD